MAAPGVPTSDAPFLCPPHGGPAVCDCVKALSVRFVEPLV